MVNKNLRVRNEVDTTVIILNYMGVPQFHIHIYHISMFKLFLTACAKRSNFMVVGIKQREYFLLVLSSFKESIRHEIKFIFVPSPFHFTAFNSKSASAILYGSYFNPFLRVKI